MRYPHRPHVPDLVVQQVAERLRQIAREQYGDVCRELVFRVRGHSLYIDAHRVGEEGEPTHLCRLDWLGRSDEWSFWFYRYTRRKYERNITYSGNWTGTAEDCFAAAAFAYLAMYRPMANPSGINGRLD
ncbi:MAG TPA: hypothetical protein VMV28_04890 [Thermoplasmata archaeon]|nr:hypothetical protein [Thermoplasmata archaeon]